MSKGKKIALIVSMVAVLVVAAVLNVTLLANKDKTPANGDAVQTSFFASSRLDRQTTRDYEIAELNQILAMEGDEYAEARQNALIKKQQIVDAMETEMLLETLLKAQGFEEVLVSVRGEPLVTKTLPPTILGVVVVAEGADNPVVRLKIMEVVVTLLNVQQKDVQVFTYKS